MVHFSRYLFEGFGARPPCVPLQIRHWSHTRNSKNITCCIGDTGNVSKSMFAGEGVKRCSWLDLATEDWTCWAVCRAGNTQGLSRLYLLLLYDLSKYVILIVVPWTKTGSVDWSEFHITTLGRINYLLNICRIMWHVTVNCYSDILLSFDFHLNSLLVIQPIYNFSVYQPVIVLTKYMFCHIDHINPFNRPQNCTSWYR